MIVERVYSPINDPNIKKNINGSTIWSECYRKEEVTDEVRKKCRNMYVYSIKFDGLKPIQVNKIEKL